MVIMKSINFEFLRAHHPTLSDLGGLTEHYVHTYPAVSLVKARLRRLTAAKARRPLAVR